MPVCFSFLLLEQPVKLWPLLSFTSDDDSQEPFPNRTANQLQFSTRLHFPGKHFRVEVICLKDKSKRCFRFPDSWIFLV
jgi:hypothetical protein